MPHACQSIDRLVDRSNRIHAVPKELKSPSISIQNSSVPVDQGDALVRLVSERLSQGQDWRQLEDADENEDAVASLKVRRREPDRVHLSHLKKDLTRPILRADSGRSPALASWCWPASCRGSSPTR